VRALATNPEKAKLPAEVEVVRGYLGCVESLPAALEGVDRMYLAPLEETVRECVVLAAEAGVQHIVDLSGGKDTWWASVAVAVEESGVAWTHLAPGEFMANMLIWAEQIRGTGEVRDGYPNAANARSLRWSPRWASSRGGTSTGCGSSRSSRSRSRRPSRSSPGGPARRSRSGRRETWAGSDEIRGRRQSPGA
jgi:uncharacterized protein YbjT (DUF2867 family)